VSFSSAHHPLKKWKKLVGRLKTLGYCHGVPAGHLSDERAGTRYKNLFGRILWRDALNTTTERLS
jgi:hypothetical protein